MKKLGIVMCVAVLAAVLCALPAVAKTPLTEKELDLISAGGQPTVIISGAFSLTEQGSHLGMHFEGSGTVTLAPDVTLVFGPGTSAQAGLRALVVNNVFGDNLVANALNIASTVYGDTGSLVQANTINQSWGATLDVGAAVGPAGDASDCNAVINFGVCGKGGTPGTVRVLSAYGDQILLGERVRVFTDTTIVAGWGDSFQRDLAALVLNNVLGFNLVANAINIASATIAVPVFNGTGNEIALIPMLTTPKGVVQTNTINQFRGTPYTRPASP